MKTLFLLLLLYHASSPVKHSLKFFFTASYGLPNFPELVVLAVVDDILAGYCDSNTRTVQPKQDWVIRLFKSDPQHLEWYTQECAEGLSNHFRGIMFNLRNRLNQTEGVHILQRMNGCEWDEETGESDGFNQYGYNGEDLISFDLKTLTWIAPKQQAVSTKLSWDADKLEIELNKNFLTAIFPEFLKKYVAYGKSTLLRKEHPSVSLLQKTPSSPVRCHATGFYPDRATLIWRKDGEELHENVEHGEILPNHDGTFQMSVDLDLSSVTPEDPRRYDCVFQLSGVKEDIVTKLVKDQIRTNWEKPSNMISITTAVLVLFICLISVTGFIIHKKRKARDPANSADNGSELSQRLKAGT